MRIGRPYPATAKATESAIMTPADTFTKRLRYEASRTAKRTTAVTSGRQKSKNGNVIMHLRREINQCTLFHE